MMQPYARQLALVMRFALSTKKYASNPDFKRLDRMKHVDFFNPELKFPMHIPLKHRYFPYSTQQEDRLQQAGRQRALTGLGGSF